jgi:hypothetical protein
LRKLIALLLVAASAVGGAHYDWYGGYNVAATEQHTAPV